MTSGIQVVVAPNFHLPGVLAERLLVARDGGWGPLFEGEMSVLAPSDVTLDQLSGLILLFALPGHLRASFWVMLEQAETGGDFGAFAAEVGRFLTFKQLPPPEHALFELVLHGAGGKIEPDGLWAILNMSDDSADVCLPGLRLRLGAGEGCRLPEDIVAEVIPPENGDPDVLLLVRRPREMEAHGVPAT
jgi:hypothetical protein